MNDLPKFIFIATVSAVPALPVSLADLFFGWYIDNRVFLTLVFFAVAIDHIIGTWVHVAVKGDFSSKKNLKGLLVKGFSVCAGYVLFEMIHQIMKDVNFIAIYFKVILQLTVLLYPVTSALKNISILNGGKFPPKVWFNKFEGFNSDLDLNHFKTTKNEENYNGSSPLPAPDGMSEPEENGGN